MNAKKIVTTASVVMIFFLLVISFGLKAQPNQKKLSIQAVIEIQDLRREVATLRGLVEAMQYQLKKLKEQQTQDYISLDTRITKAGSFNAASIDSGLSGQASTQDMLVPKTSTKTSAKKNKKQISASLYSYAFSALRSGDKIGAIESLETLIAKYPQAAEIANARYWLGETYWLSNEREKSRESFVSLLDAFPNYPKAGDVMYRLGVIYDLLGDYTSAFDYMNMVLDTDSPQASAAQIWIEKKQNVSAVEEVPALKNVSPPSNLETQDTQ